MAAADVVAGSQERRDSRRSLRAHIGDLQRDGSRAQKTDVAVSTRYSSAVRPLPPFCARMRPGFH